MTDSSSWGNGVTDNSALGTMDRAVEWAMRQGKDNLDRIIPPDKREAIRGELQAVVLANPKFSAFLALNIVLTGIPVGLFMLFGFVVLFVSLMIAITCALCAAIVVTLTAIGAALFIVFPTVLVTTGLASSIFLWCLAGYYVLQWVTIGVSRQSRESTAGQTNGDSLADGSVGALTPDTACEKFKDEKTSNE